MSLLIAIAILLGIAVVGCCLLLVGSARSYQHGFDDGVDAATNFLRVVR